MMEHLHSLKDSYNWTNLNMVKFIRRDYGVPIWFKTHDAAGSTVPFVQLLFLWAMKSYRLDVDPFFRIVRPSVLYFDIQSAIKAAASQFGLSDDWFNTQSVRMLAPTITRAARAARSNIMRMGRWKS